MLPPQQSDLPAPLRRGPAFAHSPLVLSVPHAGRHYPPIIEAMRAVPQRIVEDLEDRYVDRLIGPAVAAGAVAVVAPVARAYIDLNRAPLTMDDGHHARAGLGLVPTRLGGHGLWKAPLTAAEIEARVAAVHTPYHAMIATALDDARAQHGYAVLIDCHSMPPIRRGPGAGATLVIGDRHGTSASRAIVEAIATTAALCSFRVSRNAPYAGAYTIGHHGRPQARCDAVQLEIDRSLYLGDGLREPGSGLAMIANHLAALVQAALDAAGRRSLPEAAE